MSSVATTQTRNNDKPQPKTAKEIIAANVQSLVEQLEAGHSDALTAHLSGRCYPVQSAVPKPFKKAQTKNRQTENTRGDYVVNYQHIGRNSC
jgi:hypothetical protein